MYPKTFLDFYTSLNHLSYPYYLRKKLKFTDFIQLLYYKENLLR